MSPERLFKVTDFLHPADGEPIRSVITESADAAVVAWYVKPGQRISAHVHPDGQDTWTILSGCGEYRVSADGESIAIAKGDVLVAHRREVHGVLNSGQGPLVFVSVVLPQHRALSRCSSSLASWILRRFRCGRSAQLADAGLFIQAS